MSEFKVGFKGSQLLVIIGVVVILFSPAHAQIPLTFEGEVGMVIYFIKPDKASQWVAVMQRLKTALVTSDDPAHQAMGRGFLLFRAREAAAGGRALYVWVAGPMPTGGNYDVAALLRAYYPGDYPVLLHQYVDAIADAGEMNLDRVWD